MTHASGPIQILYVKEVEQAGSKRPMLEVCLRGPVDMLDGQMWERGWEYAEQVAVTKHYDPRGETASRAATWYNRFQREKVYQFFDKKRV